MLLKDRGYLLHQMQYKESSAIVRLFTEQHGVISGVIHGVHGSRKTAQTLRAALQPANELDILWLHKAGLKTIRQIQAFDSLASQLNEPRNYLCVSYVNELSLKLLPEDQSCQALFPRYQQVISGLVHASDQKDIEWLLRVFEWGLLTELGTVPDLHADDAGNSLVADVCYRLDPNIGLIRLPQPINRFNCFLGEHLLLLAEGLNNSQECQRAAKRLCRILIDSALDGKPLKSRELYREMIL